MSCDGEILDSIVKHEHPLLHHLNCTECGIYGGTLRKVGSGKTATYRHTYKCSPTDVLKPYNRADRRRLGLV